MICNCCCFHSIYYYLFYKGQEPKNKQKVLTEAADASPNYSEGTVVLDQEPNKYIARDLADSGVRSEEENVTGEINTQCIMTACGCYKINMTSL